MLNCHIDINTCKQRLLLYSFTTTSYITLAQIPHCHIMINPQRTCTGGLLCLSVVCLLSHISPLERLFILKILSRTRRTTEVKKFAPKLLCCCDPVFPPIHTVGHFPAESTHAHYSIYHMVAPRVVHFSAFIDFLINVYMLVITSLYDLRLTQSLSIPVHVCRLI